LRLWGKGANGQSQEQDCANTEREAAEIYLTDEITESNREKNR
jgi:hypothetical protein